VAEDLEAELLEDLETLDDLEADDEAEEVEVEAECVETEVDAERVEVAKELPVEVTLPGPTEALVVATEVGVAVEALVLVPVSDALDATPVW